MILDHLKGSKMKISLPFLHLSECAEIRFPILSIEDKESVNEWMEKNALYFEVSEYDLRDMIRFLESFIEGDADLSGYIYFPNPADKDSFFFSKGEDLIEYLDEMGIPYNGTEG